VIVIVLVAMLLVAMLIAGLRRSVAARAETRAAAVDYHREPFRSHAEASRHEHEESRT
jgi:hypothetical protein